MELWRDGLIKPVLNRGLLLHYLKLLKALRLSQPLLRRWAWWWNCKAHFISGEPAESIPVLALCAWIAKATPPACVVHSGHTYNPPLEIPQSPPVWKTARVFLAEDSAQRAAGTK
jgi:hypothetical protein